MAIDIVPTALIRQTQCSAKAPSKVDRRNGIMQCPAAEKKIKIKSSGFFDENNVKIEGIKKSGKVYLKIQGENLSGRKLLIDLSTHRDITFKQNGIEISKEESLLVDMVGNDISLELYAELID